MKKIVYLLSNVDGQGGIQRVWIGTVISIFTLPIT